MILVGKDPLGMRIFNADGSEGAMCGNGIRAVVAQHARRLQHLWSGAVVTQSGTRECEVQSLGEAGEDRVAVNMGAATITALPDGLDSPFPGVQVDVGNPHYVAFVPDCETVRLDHFGPKIECAQVFPDRINVQFATALTEHLIRLRTWERGSGITKACGTGACAVAAVHFAQNPTVKSVALELDGGVLKIEEVNASLWMTGPACHVYSGVVPD